MNAIKYQIIKLVVPSAGATVNIASNSDKLYKRISGILVTVPYFLSFLSKSTLMFQINEKEIFPDDFEVKLISCEQCVPVNERFYQLDEPAEGSTLKGRFKDGGAINGVTYPYVAYLYLKLEEKAQ